MIGTPPFTSPEQLRDAQVAGEEVGDRLGGAEGQDVGEGGGVDGERSLFITRCAAMSGLVGPERRGLAMGFNEAAGCGAVDVTAMATDLVLALATFAVRETREHARAEAAAHLVQTTTGRDREIADRLGSMIRKERGEADS